MVLTKRLSFAIQYMEYGVLSKSDCAAAASELSSADINFRFILNTLAANNASLILPAE